MLGLVVTPKVTTAQWP